MAKPHNISRKRKATVEGNPRPKRRSKRKEQIDPNKCSSCHGKFIDGEEDMGVGCDGCPRWFHKTCVSAIVYDGDWNCGYH